MDPLIRVKIETDDAQSEQREQRIASVSSSRERLRQRREQPQGVGADQREQQRSYPPRKEDAEKESPGEPAEAKPKTRADKDKVRKQRQRHRERPAAAAKPSKLQTAARVATMARGAATVPGAMGLARSAASKAGAAVGKVAPALAAYAAARGAAQLTATVTGMAGSPVTGPLREFQSLEAGVTSYLDSFRQASELRDDALLVDGLGDAYSLPLRSELATTGLKQRELAAYLDRAKANRRNAAAGRLWADALFGPKSLIGQLSQAAGGDS